MTDPYAAYPPPATPPVWSPSDQARGSSAVLGWMVAAGLGVLAALSAATVGLEVWGKRIADEIGTDRAAALSDARSFDDLNRTFSLVGLVCLLATGIFWCVWQVRVARVTPPDRIRRTPGWHAGSWFIPIGNLWMSIQNMLDLWRFWCPTRSTSLLGWWWGMWIVSNVSGRVFAGQHDPTDADSFRHYLDVGIFSDTADVVAAVLAIVVVVRLSRAVGAKR
ncbi:DUF4328 domain-containing protein [Nocardioides montaniterrae]